MKVLLFSGARRLFSISGLGRAIAHQKKALAAHNITCTEDKHEKQYDIVHINTYGFFSKRLAKKARKQGRVVVYHAHSTKEDFCNSFIGSNLIAPLFKRWIVSCYRLGDIIITPTEYSKKLLLSYGLIQPIFAVSNGVDISLYGKAEDDRAEFREKYGYNENDKVIMSAGMYFERKGITDFVKMAKEMPQYKFIWFGKTPMWTIPHKSRKAAKTKLPNLVFAGYVQPEELKKAYIGADLFAFMTKEETEGIVLLEALAARQNVIVYDIPVFDWLVDKKNVYKAKSYEEYKTLADGIVQGDLPCLADEGLKAVGLRSIEKSGAELVKAYDKAIWEAIKRCAGGK